MQQHLTSDFEKLVDALSQPEAHRTVPDDLRLVETRQSVLFFADERVYKLRKPGADGSTPEERRRGCEEALRLNRRISPGMFLGVRPVTRESGERIAFDGSGEAIDWVVEMTRLPAEEMLDARLARGDLGREELHGLVTELVRFHERATTDPLVNEHGLSSAVSAQVLESLERLELASPPDLVRSHTWSHLRERTTRLLETERDLFERRVAHWRVRECHGDLHAARICIVGDAVFVFGCADRDRRLRCGDVARDLAALVVDLDRRGHRATANELVRDYVGISSDEDLERLVDFYKIQRALLRAEEALVPSESSGPDERSESIALARTYAELASDYALPPARQME